MTRVLFETVEGNAMYERRKLADWVPGIVDKLGRTGDAERVVMFGSVAGRVDGRYTGDRAEAECDLAGRPARFAEQVVVAARSDMEANDGDE